MARGSDAAQPDLGGGGTGRVEPAASQLPAERAGSAERPRRGVVAVVSPGGGRGDSRTRFAPPDWLRPPGPRSVLVTGLCVTLPFWVPTYWLFLATQSVIYSVAVLSVIVLRRATAATSLCQAAFMGVAAYLAAWLSSEAGWPYLPAVLIGVLAVIPTGMALALPALRLRGLDLSVLTLCVGLAATAVVFDPQAPLRFSDRGAPLSGPPRPFGIDLSSVPRMYLYQLAVAVVALGAVSVLFRSPLGMSWQAQRAGNAVAAALGIPIVRMQIIALGVSAGLAGLSGVMLLTLQQAVTADSFSTSQSVLLVVIAAFVGSDRPAFAAFGGVVLGLGQHIFSTFGLSGDWVTVVFGFGLAVHILTANAFGRTARTPGG